MARKDLDFMSEKILSKEEFITLLEMHKRLLLILSPAVPDDARLFYDDLVIAFECNISRIKTFVKIKEEYDDESASKGD